MDSSSLLQQLAAPDAQQRQVAADALVAAGVASVGPLVATLCDENSPVYWAHSGSVLRKIGDPALGPLVETIATASTAEVARRASWAFVGLEVSDKGDVRAGVATSTPASQIGGSAGARMQALRRTPFRTRPRSSRCSPTRSPTYASRRSAPSKRSVPASFGSCDR